MENTSHSESSGASWSVRISDTPQKQLKKIPAHDARRIFTVFEDMCQDPYVGDVVKLSGYENEWRRRSGNYRIHYSIDTTIKTIYVTNVERRTSTSYKRRRH